MNKDKNKLQENLLFIAWAASVIAMLGSLFFSEVQKFEPCELCWYQRILMYPMVLILVIAIVKKDFRISFYTMFLSAVGAVISLYHYSIQKVPFMADNAVSCGRIPCTGQYINWLGFVTIPFLALIAFVIIFICSLFIWRFCKGEESK
ncbi:disulfide oxidoreductase [Bacillus marasmi]|uniref:disulfide oxidoreductase n=1 Tax=Bacillus marasmi TaxID=1926279 RepID=UPI0011C8D4FB|nr:disulfide oxidoreductase [Bacillus marasmi]